jgi:hypothetical protein
VITVSSVRDRSATMVLAWVPSTPFAQKIASQVAAYWGTPKEDDSWGKPQALENDCILSSLVEPHKQLVEEEGYYASKILPSINIPGGGATTMDVLLAAAHAAEAVSKSEVLWAVSARQCHAAGCKFAAESKVVLPAISGPVIKAARSEIADLSVKPCDTVDSLLARLSSSSVLDDILAPLKGHGKGGRTERLNASTMSQPRRVSYSLRGSDTFEREGSEVEMKFNYTAYRVKPRHHVARRMPASVFDLALAVWLAARPIMGDCLSAEIPFTHVQLLLYYSAFHASIQQHRDNQSAKDFCAFMDGLTTGGGDGHCASHGQENSQAANSWVAVYTTGSGEMVCTLRFPPKEDPMCNRGDYVAKPLFKLPLGPGTLFLMSPKDDLFFTHEAEFEVEFEVPADGAIGESVLREAWVFRHLGSVQCFHTQTGKNRRFVDEQILKAESVLGRKRAQKQANERRQLLKRGF